MPEKTSVPEKKKDPPTIASARCRRVPLAGGEIAEWLEQFNQDLKERGFAHRDVCALVADLVKSKNKQRWVGEAKFADMVLWLWCRGDVSRINRIGSGASIWDFHVDVYPWPEVDVYMSGDQPVIPREEAPNPSTESNPCLVPPGGEQERAEARVQ